MCDTLKGTIYYRDRQGLIAVDYSAQLKVSGGHMFLSNGAVSVRVSNKSLEFVQQKIVLNAGLLAFATILRQLGVQICA